MGNKPNFRSSSFLPRFFYILTALLAILFPFLIYFGEVYNTIIFTIPYFIVLSITFLLFWMGKLNRNLNSDLASIQFFIVFLLILSLFVIGKSGLFGANSLIVGILFGASSLGIALIIGSLILLLILGSFMGLVASIVTNKAYKILAALVIAFVFSVLFTYLSVSYQDASVDAGFNEEALSEKDITRCMSIRYDDELRDNCMIELVKSSGDGDYRIEICDEFEDNFKKSQCVEIINEKTFLINSRKLSHAEGIKININKKIF